MDKTQEYVYIVFCIRHTKNISNILHIHVKIKNISNILHIHVKIKNISNILHIHVKLKKIFEKWTVEKEEFDTAE